jgi:hypothetical protein
MTPRTGLFLGAACVALATLPSCSCGESGSVPSSGAGGGASTGVTGGGGAAGGAGGEGGAGAIETLALPPTTSLNDGTFATSLVCADCHSNADGASAMRDETGAEVGFFDFWQSTMMANSARDPLFRAVVSAEVAATPSAKGLIEAKCTRCHAPMASTTVALLEQPSIGLDTLGEDTDLGTLARDGVSCALCHQIQPDGLGSDASFTGHFVVQPLAEMYGPHASPFAMPMTNMSGFTPKQADHVVESALCGSCHTLETDALAPDGSMVGAVLPEQTPYLEWRNSDFVDEGTPGPLAASCQDCHVPTTSAAGVPIVSRIARNPGGFDFPPVDDRSPFGRHLFIGANTLVPRLLKDFRDVLQPLATDAALDRTIALARAQLAENSVLLSLPRAERLGDFIEVDVHLANLTGHKFPTAHPSRRAWLDVEVRDANGALVFRSGGFDESNRLVDATGAPLPSELVAGGFLPHVDEVESSEQVYVLESVMGDAAGTPTYGLLRGATYLKDSRLLPSGYDPGHPDAARTAPVGTSTDANFVAGADTVTYRVSAPAASGPFEVTATLRYLTLSARYAGELFAWQTPETKALALMLAASPGGPELVGTVATTLD